MRNLRQRSTKLQIKPTPINKRPLITKAYAFLKTEDEDEEEKEEEEEEEEE